MDAENDRKARQYKVQKETDRILARDKRTKLTESERRYIELEYGTIGRSWLRAIRQLPDWDLKLDSQGRIIGRKSKVTADADSELTVG